ncbi:uncharacterized protein LOC119839436 [Zerene cesonia]|uniref:uncharacterized protein LOC119839436 n=1 Tax=Zerene cesonia TaxID=33412 RepID=UPI0018E50567|nr:uncharacterized protein LOC119839436 [Zerene cesonia]
MAKSRGTKTTEFRDVGVSTEDQKFYGACPHFKENKLNIHDMVDVWQTVYYQAAEKVPCFKILIRTLSTIERKLNAQKYGSFENKVFWDNCTLEIKSDTTAMKHFLQETSLDHGILLNVIIEFGNATKLVNEGPDQWFVQKNLLLMKDCSSGDVVVFARVPFLPRKDVIMEGLKLTSDSTSGKYTCVDPASSSRDKDMEFEIFSDMNEFF